MKEMPIKNFMTPMPHTINSGMPIKMAKQIMRKYAFRHLPVQLSGHLVGIITDRDIKLALSFKDADQLLVDDVMTPDPFAVFPETPLNEVVRKMSEKKYGCAVIQKNGKVVGVFTSTDGMRAFGEALDLGGKGKAKKKGVRK